ncbi:hypothetical protein VOM14_13415 [Paraburkholderia sp. MPAMCS5]|uniref:hypothetical protein n=1 Tax=Paraburkholderia sp. MPAMCS5 TaxID=3112563 RepID=UPI002E176930|nr:hypothetical protein [Paraburkholderia sp. MPAMCS5]
MGEVLMMAANAIDVEQVLDACEDQLRASGDALSRIGARLVVLCKFVDAVLPQLSEAQCKLIGRSFREGIEDALSRTDDVAVPRAYHTTLLEQINILLTALEREPPR